MPFELDTLEMADVLAGAVRDVTANCHLSLDGPSSPGHESLPVAAIVGIAGRDFRGLLHLGCTYHAAATLAAALIPDEEAEDTALVTDSLGELALMLAEAVKRRLDDISEDIETSLAAVVEGPATISGIGVTGRVRFSWVVDRQPVTTDLIFSR